MVKQKKKRTKKYSGAEAAVTRPVVTRVTAANRSKFGQWWFERKRILKPVLITAGVATLLVWLIIEIIRIANGSY
ncbi:hypothetical protein D3C72_1166900 [compost metagenome]